MLKKPRSPKKTLIDRTKNLNRSHDITKNLRHCLDFHAITRRISAGEKCGLAAEGYEARRKDALRG